MVCSFPYSVRFAADGQWQMVPPLKSKSDGKNMRGPPGMRDCPSCGEQTRALSLSPCISSSYPKSPSSPFAASLRPSEAANWGLRPGNWSDSGEKACAFCELIVECEKREAARRERQVSGSSSKAEPPTALNGAGAAVAGATAFICCSLLFLLFVVLAFLLLLLCCCCCYCSCARLSGCLLKSP